MTVVPSSFPVLQIQSAVFHYRPPSAKRCPAPRRWTCSTEMLTMRSSVAAFSSKYLNHFSFDIGITNYVYGVVRPDKTHVAIKCRWRFAYPAYKNTVQAVSKFAMVQYPDRLPRQVYCSTGAFAISGGTVNVQPAFAVISTKCDRKPAAVLAPAGRRAAGVVQFRS